MSYITYTSIIELNKRAVSDISSFQNLQSSGHFSTDEIRKNAILQLLEFECTFIKHFIKFLKS